MILRKHQQELSDYLDDVIASPDKLKKPVICSVCPGGGKSMLPQIVASKLIGSGLIDKVCVVTPRQSLQMQMACDFENTESRNLLGHTLSINESTNQVNPCRGTSGYVTTVQAIDSDGSGINQYEFLSNRYALIIDELHHLKEGGSWHLAIQPLIDSAVFNLGMTGTIFRADNQRIAGLPYTNNNGLVGIDFASKSHHFISYSRKDALKDKAIIPCVFHQIDGKANWLEPDGTANSVDSFTENSNESRKGVHTAVRTKYAESMMDEATTHYLLSLAKHPESKMLVVSPNIALAKSHKDYLIKKSIPCEIATSNDSNAALEAINNFRYQKHSRVLVTVGMAYEGLDVPSITHLALLTHIRSLPWLDQVFARTTRFNRNSSATYDDQVATIFAPNDFLINQIISDIRTEETQFISNDSENITTNLPPQSTNSGSDSGQIIPINSAMTGVTAVGLDENQIILSSAQISGVQDLIKSSGFDGVSEINMAKFLSSNGIEIPECEAANDPVMQKPSTTKYRCLAIRRSIEDIIRNHEYHNNIEYGTTNKILKKHFGKARHEMTESELLDVLPIVEQHYGIDNIHKHSLTK